MIRLKTHQYLHNLVPLGQIRNQRTPDEDGVAHCDGQRDCCWRAFAYAADDTGVFEDCVLVRLVFVCYR